MITVHHLSFSRSTRIIWLLEELDLRYGLVRYERDAQFKAPASLRDIHPLGKAPVIQDGDLVLAESAVILDYINTRYGGGRFAPAAGSSLEVLHQEWLQYVESTAALPIMMLRLGELGGGLSDQLKRFIEPTLAKTLDYIAAAVDRSPYLLGPQFTIADIQMSYVLEMARSGGLLADHRPLAAYLDRLKARDGFVKAVAIGGPMAPPSKQ